MYKLVLFDLDGTLLPLDIEVFVKNYFVSITDFFQDVVDPQVFLHNLKQSTRAMARNQGDTVNEEVFMKNFLPAVGRERDFMYPRFQLYYEKEFPKLKEYAGFSPWAQESVTEVLNKGYPIVLATNPLFPRMATVERMSWARISQYPWSMITTYENSRRCKPNVQYYQDICRRMGVQAKDCLMIGNDVQEDIVAGTLGMDTFLVTDHLIDRGNPVYHPGHQGTLSELAHFMKEMPQYSPQGC
ncbi:HAD family hydrolase [Dehalobacterium formicoaceticum]|uniref:HAD family hydrolase n=1 Tax=Dehalobacterium formicoaceticum TaxID=51515 RepID=UPI0012F963BB|nr:HAD family hydrolase [Dehalobacterium formicoaceticum]